MNAKMTLNELSQVSQPLGIEQLVKVRGGGTLRCGCLWKETPWGTPYCKLICVSIEV